MVSVVIAVHNGEPFLDTCIASVLAQEYEPLECIVVDDGSTDRTREIAERHGVRCIGQPRSGVARARNVGIASARGDLVAFLDADDVWLPSKLARQVRVLGDRPALGMVYTGYVVADDHLRPVGAFLARDGADQIVRWLTFDGWGIAFGSTGVVPRRVLEHLGGFDESLSTSADKDLCWRIAREFEIAAVREPLAVYRSHRNQMHRNLAAVTHDHEALRSKVFGDRGSPLWKTRRRARANLAVRVGLAHLSEGRLRAGAASLLQAGLTRPDRLVAAPVEACVRRIRHRTGLGARLALGGGRRQRSWPPGELLEARLPG